MTVFVTRFAPSPTGYLHLGHAFAALTAFDAAQAAGGRFLLRIEDIDEGRSRPAFEDAIYEDLAWLGLEWERPPRRQSEHFDEYAAALSRLIEDGLVYRCFRTRKEIIAEIARAPHGRMAGPDGPAYVGAPLPAGQERALLEQGVRYAWRLSMSAAAARLGERFGRLSFLIEDNDGEPCEVAAYPHRFGDVVLARKDAGASYHLAATHDDAQQGISHVIRGEDLADAAPLHVLLQALFGWPTPVYRHHRLILDETGKRLAKRDQAMTLRALRQAGETPASLRARLGLRSAR